MMEESFDLVPFAVELLVVAPGFLHVGFGRHDGNAALLPDCAPCLLVRIAFVHDDSGARVQRGTLEQLPSFGSIVRIAGAQRKRTTFMRSRSDKMNLRGQPTT